MVALKSVIFLVLSQWKISNLHMNLLSDFKTENESSGKPDYQNNMYSMGF